MIGGGPPTLGMPNCLATAWALCTVRLLTTSMETPWICWSLGMCWARVLPPAPMTPTRRVGPMVLAWMLRARVVAPATQAPLTSCVKCDITIRVPRTWNIYVSALHGVVIT